MPLTTSDADCARDAFAGALTRTDRLVAIEAENKRLQRDRNAVAAELEHALRMIAGDNPDLAAKAIGRALSRLYGEGR